MIIKYYYLRGKGNEPRLTRCLVKDKEKIAVGSALCSYSDFPNKKVGKQIALGRALKTLKEERNLYPINREEADEILCDVESDLMDYTNLKKFERDFKGLFIEDDNYLNFMERKLLEVK